MTTPQERMRSIGWGAELLGRLRQDATIPEDLKLLARQAAVSYPSTATLLELLTSLSLLFPAEAGRSVEAARTLFEKVRSVGAGTEETRRHLLYTMRHFPLPGWAEDADVAARLGRLDYWLAAEGL